MTPGTSSRRPRPRSAHPHRRWALLGLWLLPGALPAQEVSRVVGVAAEVVRPAMTGGGVQPLVFGPLAPGMSAQVRPGPAAGGVSSAGWRFHELRRGHSVGWMLVLPVILTNGGHALPVEWDGPDYGLACLAAPSGECLVASSFDPAGSRESGPSRSLLVPDGLPGSHAELRIYVGARTTVPAVPPGTYGARATLYFTPLF